MNEEQAFQVIEAAHLLERGRELAVKAGDIPMVQLLQQALEHLDKSFDRTFPKT